MTFWIIAIVVVAAVLLLALVWWSSGRARRAPGTNADFEKGRGQANLYDRGTM
jgi:DNA-binding transcriptional regulator of glucitol operon